jgi:uncharacterized protein YecT (DUF1311 family)
MHLSTLIKITVSSVFLMTYAGFACAEEDSAVKNICQKVAATPIPSGDQPDSALRQALKECDAADLYYGFHQPANAVKARQCAYATEDYPVLTMIYANGKGVERNWDLAIHFACRAGFAQAEVDGRVAHLVKLRDQHWQGTDFDICDDITSGYMMGVCASYQEQLAQQQRQKQFVTLTASWSEADKQALQNLQKSADHFFEVRSENEVDLSGTARAQEQIDEQAALRKGLLTLLQHAADGHLPVYTTQQSADADRRLNKIYQDIQNNQDFSMGTVDRAGIKKTQFAWLKYRDAWVTFGKIKYPQISVDTWKTLLTEQRIKMLQDLV